MVISYSSFGNGSLVTAIGTSQYPQQIILAADGLHYLIACAGSSPRVVQTSLDGTTSSVLFTTTSANDPFYRAGRQNLFGICYNPTKTKFILILDRLYIVETDLDGKNPVIKLDATTKIYGTNILALAGGPYRITMSYDNQYYLVTMYDRWPDGTSKIIQIPAIDMGNPTIFKQGTDIDANNVFPMQLSYSIDGTKLLANAWNNPIIQMNLDGSSVSVLYTKAALGINYAFAGLCITADRTGYLVVQYGTRNFFVITEYSTSQPLPTYPPTVPYQPPAPPAPVVPVITNPPVFNDGMANANTNLAHPGAQTANFDQSALVNQRSGATLANSVMGFYDAASRGQIRPNRAPLFSSYQQMMAWKQGMNRR